MAKSNEATGGSGTVKGNLRGPQNYQGASNTFLSALLGAGQPGAASALFNTSMFTHPSARAYYGPLKQALDFAGQQQTQTENLQNAILGEQLQAAQSQNAKARTKTGGSGVLMGNGSMMGSSGGGTGFRNQVMTQQTPRPDRYGNQLQRDERGKDMALERGDYKDRAKFDAELQQQMLEQEEARKMELYRKILARFGGGETTRGSSTTTGGSYQNIGGRPVYMPESSTTNTSQTNPISKLDILKLLDIR